MTSCVAHIMISQTMFVVPSAHGLPKPAPCPLVHI